MSYFILLFLLLRVSNGLVGPRFMVAELGGSVNITCQYRMSIANINGRKFWCKTSEVISGCSTVISTTRYVANEYKRRVWLVDAPSEGKFQMEMANLKREDSGRYRCGIGGNNDGFFFSVFLAVSEGPNMNDQLEVVHGMLRGSVVVGCRFNESSIDKMYWCKMERTGGCHIIADTEGYMEQRYKGRLLIVAEANVNLFKILISHLLEEDAGRYRCGIGTVKKCGTWKNIEMHISKDSTTSALINETTAISTFMSPTSTVQNHATDYETTVVTFNSNTIRESTTSVPTDDYDNTTVTFVSSTVQGNCKLPPRFQYGELLETFTNRNVFPVGAKVTYKCRPGYVIMRRSPRTITCLSTLMWTEIEEFCQRRDCGNPEEIPNGDAKYEEDDDGQIDTKFGSSVTFVCNVGFRLVGRERRVCTAHGWNNALPNCEAVICPKPPDIPNGTHTSMDQDEFQYRRAVTYSCKSKAFSLIGKASIYCTEDADWSGPAPQCKVIRCANPRVPNADRISGFGVSHTYKDSVGFACKAGFVMSGSSLVQCGEDDEWHPPVPVCQLPHVLELATSTTTSKFAVSFTRITSTIPGIQAFTTEGTRGTPLKRHSRTDAEEADTVLAKSTPPCKLSATFTSQEKTISDTQAFTAEGERGTWLTRHSIIPKEAATVSTKSTVTSIFSASFTSRAPSTSDAQDLPAESERGTMLLRNSTTDADKAATDTASLSDSANTISTASTTVISLTASRGRNEPVYQERTVSGSENPQLEGTASTTRASSNHTVFKDGWKTSDRNLLLFVVPSLVLALLLLLGAGAIIIIRDHRCWKYKVRQPVSANGSHVPMAESRYLQEGAGTGSPSVCDDEETAIDQDDVNTSLLQRATFTTFTGDT